MKSSRFYSHKHIKAPLGGSALSIEVNYGNRTGSPVTDQEAARTLMPFSWKCCCNSPAWNISRTMSQPPMNSPLT
ncbi:hypothetical protein GA0061102_103637 [Rhizobium miluonense]|uniref:Uncharacterized protein n=1 Tax=Rhizobium miluonense TaxID=411945 RepID=A0A1C3WQH1_9HYPH|nr:hypothetical protein GA0061102_103637 [Rhizobium miluonense]